MNDMKKDKKIILITLLCITIIGMALTLFINIYMVSSTKNQIIDLEKVGELTDVDAILILGCKVEEDNSPSLMLVNRLNMGEDVYNKIHSKILLSGDSTREDYDEVNVMAEYLNNIDSSEIIKDYAGINTYDSIYRAKNTFGLKKIIIVTQKYHMYRALYIANKLGIEAVGVVASDIPYKFIMLKNEVREILSRDKNFFKVMFNPKSRYLEEKIA